MLSHFIDEFIYQQLSVGVNRIFSFCFSLSYNKDVIILFDVLLITINLLRWPKRAKTSQCVNIKLMKTYKNNHIIFVQISLIWINAFWIVVLCSGFFRNCFYNIICKQHSKIKYYQSHFYTPWTFDPISSLGLYRK